MFFLNPIILVLLIFVIIIPNVYHECINLLWLMWKKWGISYLFKNFNKTEMKQLIKFTSYQGRIQGGGQKRHVPPPKFKKKGKKGK